MDINTKQGFLDAVKDIISEQLAKAPILSQRECGGANVPTYLKDGLLTACSDVMGVDAYVISGGLTSSGYIKFTNGFTVQWGVQSLYEGENTVEFPISFNTTVSKIFLQRIVISGSTLQIEYEPVIWDITSATEFTVYCTHNNVQYMYLAIGY